MKKGIYIFVLFLMGLSCERNPFHGTGKTVSEVRYVPDFHSIVLEDDIDILLINDSAKTGEIVLKGGEKLLTDVQTKVVDSVLYISDNNTFNWLRSYKKRKISMSVQIRKIRHISYKGCGNILCQDTLKSDELVFECWDGMGEVTIKIHAEKFMLTLHSGSPDVAIEGYSRKAHFYTSSNGCIEARACLVDSLSVHNRGTANMFVNAGKTLGATIEFFGNVYYINDPQILWEVEENKGKLIHID